MLSSPLKPPRAKFKPVRLIWKKDAKADAIVQGVELSKFVFNARTSLLDPTHR